MEQGNPTQLFERQLLPHFDSAYAVARRLTRNDEDASDIVQEAYLRAFRFYRGLRGGEARPWLLKIVRNVFYSSVRKNQWAVKLPIEDGSDGFETSLRSAESILIENSQRHRLLRLLDDLPETYRAVLVLREIQGLSYKQISEALQIPKGTVMSRLSRARLHLRECFHS